MNPNPKTTPFGSPAKASSVTVQGDVLRCVDGIRSATIHGLSMHSSLTPCSADVVQEALDEVFGKPDQP